MIRRVAIASVTGLAVLVLGAAVVAAADPDLTPPTGTLMINGDAAYTNTRVLDLEVPATDDVGVVEVWVSSAAGGPWTVFPYAPRITWEHPSSAEGSLEVNVSWYDAAGNHSEATRTIVLDTTPPEIDIFRETGPAPEGMLSFSVTGTDSVSEVTSARLSSDGATWGAAVPITLSRVDWVPFDLATGGSLAIGPRTVHLQVGDGAGNWSAARTTSVFVAAPSLSIGVSPAPRTGSPITLTPHLPEGMRFPAGTTCMWELMWGDDDSLYLGKRNETFGFVMTLGSDAQGWCSPWTFTLPWGPLPRYLVHFRANVPGGTLADETIGGEMGSPLVEAVVGTTDRRIRSSNIPVVYILPDSFDVVVGQRVTYRAYPVGGATISPDGYWLAAAVADEVIQQSGGSSFTFKPNHPGHWTVCWGTSTELQRYGACFDPPVKPAAASTPGPTVPLVARSPSPSSGTGSPTPGASGSPAPPPVLTPSPSADPTATPDTAAVSGAPNSPASNEPTQPSSPVKRPPRSPELPGWLPVVLGVGMVVAVLAALRRSGRLDRWLRRAR